MDIQSSGRPYTADEAAAHMNLHVRTVRRYIRDGRLNAKRIGKEYRIARADLDAFLGSAGAGDPPVAPTRLAIASTIVDVDVIGHEEGARITNLLTASLNVSQGELNSPRIDTIYYEDRARLRVTITASLALTCDLLRTIDALVEAGRS